MIGDFMKNMHGFAAKIEGVMRPETIRLSERDCKQAVLQSFGMLVMCQDDSCDCVHKIFKERIDTSKCEIVAVQIVEGEASLPAPKAKPKRGRWFHIGWGK